MSLRNVGWVIAGRNGNGTKLMWLEKAEAILSPARKENVFDVDVAKSIRLLSVDAAPTTGAMITSNVQYKKALKELEGWNESMKKMEVQLSPEQFRIYQEVNRPLLEELKIKITDWENIRYECVPVFFDLFALGPWLIRERIHKKMTQAQIAKKLMISQAQFSRIEAAEYRNSSYLFIEEVCWCLGFKFHQLMFSKTPPERGTT
jgi:hypothetical protein